MITPTKLRNNRPAPVSRTRAIATSAAVRNWRLAWRDAELPRSPALSAALTSMPEPDHAGANPTSSTVTTLIAVANRKTGNDS